MGRRAAKGPGPRTGTREQWLKERVKLLKEEKALTRKSDELAREEIAAIESL